MKEMVCMDMLQTLHDLEQNAFHTSRIKTFMIPCLHQLVEVPVHVFHGNVQLFGEWIKKNVECGDEMLMIGKCPEEDHFAKF